MGNPTFFILNTSLEVTTYNLPPLDICILKIPQTRILSYI